jgi:hypothetical protein
MPVSLTEKERKEWDDLVRFDARCVPGKPEHKTPIGAVDAELRRLGAENTKMRGALETTLDYWEQCGTLSMDVTNTIRAALAPEEGRSPRA